MDEKGSFGIYVQPDGGFVLPVVIRQRAVELCEQVEGHGKCERVADFSGACIALGWNITQSKPIWAQHDSDFEGAESALAKKCADEGARCTTRSYSYCSKGKRFQSQGGVQEYGNVQDLQYGALEWGGFGYRGERVRVFGPGRDQAHVQEMIAVAGMDTVHVFRKTCAAVAVPTDVVGGKKVLDVRRDTLFFAEGEDSQASQDNALKACTTKLDRECYSPLVQCAGVEEGRKYGVPPSGKPTPGEWGGVGLNASGDVKDLTGARSQQELQAGFASTGHALLHTFRNACVAVALPANAAGTQPLGPPSRDNISVGEGGDMKTAQVMAMRACMKKPGVANCVVTNKEVCAGKPVAPTSQIMPGEWGAIGLNANGEPMDAFNHFTAERAKQSLLERGYTPLRTFSNTCMALAWLQPAGQPIRLTPATAILMEGPTSDDAVEKVGRACVSKHGMANCRWIRKATCTGAAASQ